MEGDVITMADLFEFEQTGMDGQRIVGRIRPTGLRPKNIDRIIPSALVAAQPSTPGFNCHQPCLVLDATRPGAALSGLRLRLGMWGGE